MQAQTAKRPSYSIFVLFPLIGAFFSVLPAPPSVIATPFLVVAALFSVIAPKAHNPGGHPKPDPPLRPACFHPHPHLPPPPSPKRVSHL